MSEWMMHDIAVRLDLWPFGNRKGRSTSHYLVHLVQHLHQALQDCRSTQLLAIDYSNTESRKGVAATPFWVYSPWDVK